MASRLLDSRCPEAWAEEVGEGVQALVRELVKQALNRTPTLVPRDPHTNGQEVILDMKVDGMRYLLVRRPGEASSARRALSPREQEIARMVAKGYPNKLIAGELDISAWTVCTHLRRMFAKLGVSSRAAMIARLLDDGAFGERP